MDVLSILRKKQQPLGFYHVRVEGDQRDEHPRVYTEIRIVHEVEGAGIDRGRAERADRAVGVALLLDLGDAVEWRRAHQPLVRAARCVTGGGRGGGSDRHRPARRTGQGGAGIACFLIIQTRCGHPHR